MIRADGSCGCQAHDQAAELREVLRAKTSAKKPRGRDRLRVDGAALQRALGGRDEVIEALEVREEAAKASGKPGANVGRLWSFLTRSLYQSGDLPVLSVREQVPRALRPRPWQHHLRIGRWPAHHRRDRPLDRQR